MMPTKLAKGQALREADSGVASADMLRHCNTQAATIAGRMQTPLHKHMVLRELFPAGFREIPPVDEILQCFVD